jgi:hypothetical protein
MQTVDVRQQHVQAFTVDRELTSLCFGHERPPLTKEPLRDLKHG